MKSLDDIDREKLLRIKAVVTDVDGVLTDGSINYTTSGEQLMRFDVRDGAGIRAWCLAGGMFAFLTGRSSAMVARRALELDITAVMMNAGKKLPFFERLLGQLGVVAEEVLYIGDDWPDIPCLCRAGVGIAVADAVAEVQEIADAVTCCRGGRGAVREVLVRLLKTQDKFDKLMEYYK